LIALHSACQRLERALTPGRLFLFLGFGLRQW
jgi:hypothetical protein